MIELMVVVTLIAMLTVSIIGMFLSMVRGGGRAQGLALVKEEGDYAVSNLERIIRYGTSGCTQVNVSTDPDEISFTNQFDVDTTISFDSSLNTLVVDDGYPREITSDRVEVINASIKCFPTSGGFDRVVISFTLSDVAGSVTEDFRASVSMRNSN